MNLRRRDWMKIHTELKIFLKTKHYWHYLS